LLWQGIPTAPPSGAPSFVGYIWWVILLAFALGIALIILLSRNREDVQLTDRNRASSAESLIKTRDIELADAIKARDKAIAEKEDAESENRTLAGINIQKLMDFWAQKETLETELDVAQSKIRRLEGVIKRMEESGIPK
jgi:hypothetical protein